ncbi:MAG: hypothetical protein R3D32_00680 [Nitratireductor sp.]
MNTGNLLAAALAVCALSGTILDTSPALADPAGDFLAQLGGSYRGRGMAKILNRDKAEPVSCKVSNVYVAEKSELEVNGECASAQGKSKVNGSITHNGNSISGALIASVDGSTVTGSRGSLNGGELVINSNLVDNATGNLTRTRQVIRIDGGGFVAEFYSYDNKSAQYELNGTMRFSGS